MIFIHKNYNYFVGTLLLSSGVSASLVMTSFVISETEASRNLAVYVCVDLMGNRQEEVTLELTAESGSAEGMVENTCMLENAQYSYWFLCYLMHTAHSIHLLFLQKRKIFLKHQIL